MAGDDIVPSPVGGRSARSVSNATATRVGDFVAERKAEKDKAFSSVLSWVGRLFAGGALLFIPVRALSFFYPDWVIIHLSSVVYLAWGASMVLLSTLPLDTFDVDATVDSLPAARRMTTVALGVIFTSKALAFPYVPGGVGVCVCLVKFVWEELEIGCCARSQQVGRGGCGHRPRLTTIFCIYYVVLASGLHNIAQIALMAPCSASAADSNSTANATNTTTASPMCLFGYVCVCVRVCVLGEGGGVARAAQTAAGVCV